MLKVNNISGGYGASPVVQNISFEVKKGEFLGILGPNGCGKSTLLKIISGILTPMSGTILIDGKNSKSYSKRALAKKMTILPQLQGNHFSTTVRESVAIGRYPYQSSFLYSWSEEDERAVVKAMQQTDIEKYEHQVIDNLSGGERQRVMIAQALAQSSELLLLDEPTNHLDISHQKKILDMLWKEVKNSGLTVVSVLHDINLASLYCDHLLLMENGVMKEFGEPHEVIIDRKIQDVYQARISIQAHPEQPKPQMDLLPDINHVPNKYHVSLEHLKLKDGYIEFTTKYPLRVLSSAVHNAGFGWFQTFINRTVEPEYNIYNVKNEYKQFLIEHGYSSTNTVGMMTAVNVHEAVVKEYSAPFGKVFIVVTAGVRNAVDVSKTYSRDYAATIGTINTWVIINGKLSDEAFVQVMMTATEAKSKALQHEQIMDPLSNTIATGTPTDSILVAATQQGDVMQYGGPITEVGKFVGKGVYEATVEAIQHDLKNQMT